MCTNQHSNKVSGLETIGSAFNAEMLDLFWFLQVLDGVPLQMEDIIKGTNSYVSMGI